MTFAKKPHTWALDKGRYLLLLLVRTFGLALGLRPTSIASRRGKRGYSRRPKNTRPWRNNFTPQGLGKSSQGVGPTPGPPFYFAWLPLSLTKSKNLFWIFSIIYILVILGLPLAALFRSAGAAFFDDFWEVASSPVAVAAYRYTLAMALFAASFNGFFGLLLAWVLVRYQFWGRRTLDSAVDLPFALPTSVAGLTLASLYSEKTILGQFLSDHGIYVLFTPLAVGIAMIFVSFPFVVRTVKPVLQSIEKELEEAAWSLGAGSFTTFRKVLFPSIKSPLITGMTLAFSRAVGEYGSIVVVSSNMPEKDLISSVLIFQNLEQYSHRSAAIIGTMMLILSLTLLFAVNAFSFRSPRR